MTLGLQMMFNKQYLILIIKAIKKILIYYDSCLSSFTFTSLKRLSFFAIENRSLMTFSVRILLEFPKKWWAQFVLWKRMNMKENDYEDYEKGIEENAFKQNVFFFIRKFPVNSHVVSQDHL